VVSTPPEIGGGERYVELLVRHVRGDFAVLTQLKELRSLASGWGIPAWRLWGSVKFYGSWRVRLFVLLLPLYWLQYCVHFLRWRPDVVHVQSNEEKISVALPARLLRIPVVWTMHGPIDVSGSRLYARLFAWAGARVHTVICVSEYVRKSLLDTGVSSAKVLVIANGVDLAEHTFEYHPGRYVTFLGRLEEVKNPALFVDACLAVADSHPRARFRVIGSGTLEPGLRSMVSRAGKESSFQFAGWSSDPRPLLREASVLVISSDDEGQGFAALEAMALGVPVVATAVGGLAEVVDDGATGVLCRPRSVESVSAGITRVLSDDTFARELALRAREKVEAAYSLEHMLARTERVYAKAVDAD
jgi:glycosyltransferase involved in cell wall biosynthesis